MSTRRAIDATLHNFLGTFASRYSNYHGYWLFGFLASDIDGLEIDLLAEFPTRPPLTPIQTARVLASRGFREQATKAGVLQWITNATLKMEKLPGDVRVQVNSHELMGFPLSISVCAHSDQARDYCHATVLHVAPHNSSAEMCSASNGRVEDGA